MGRPPSTGCHFNLFLLLLFVVILVVVIVVIVVVVVLFIVVLPVVVAPCTVHFEVLVVFIIVVVNCSGRRSKLGCELRGRIFWAHRGAPRARANHCSGNVASHIGFRRCCCDDGGVVAEKCVQVELLRLRGRARV